MSAAKILRIACFSFIAGIVLNSFFGRFFYPAVGIFIFLVLLAAFFKKPGLSFFILFGLLFFSAGFLKNQRANDFILNNPLKSRYLENSQINFEGTVLSQTVFKSGYQQITLSVYKVNNEPIKNNGKVLITTNRYPEYFYGDSLFVSGEPELAPVFEGFNYRDYLYGQGVFLTLAWPQIRVLATHQGNGLKEMVLSFKSSMEAALSKMLSPPHLGFLEALLFGDESNISSAYKEKLNLTGTRHIAAVSGTNLTIIVFIVLNFLLFLGLWRQTAIIVSLVLIVFYVLMVGAPASAVRAGIMAGLYLLAQLLGRHNFSGHSLLAAATLMLAFNPRLLLTDIGFQLSFLAMAGLVYIQPILAKRFGGQNLFSGLKGIFVATLSAQIMVWPILIYNFGQVSFTGLLANVLIVPLLAPATILGFLAAFSGLIFFPLGRIISWFCYFLVGFIIKVVDWLYLWQSASLKVSNLSPFWLLFLYSLLVFWIWRASEKEKMAFLDSRVRLPKK